MADSAPTAEQLLTHTEWLTRLARYPQRMFSRYVIGNPAYLSRVLGQALFDRG